MARNRIDDNPTRSPGRFAYEGLDRLLHERARLSILSSLAAHPQGLVFTDLKKLCALTDGNLSRQLQILQEQDLIEIWKGQQQHNKRPSTMCRLTPGGRERFAQYLAELKQVIADAASAKTLAVSSQPPMSLRSLPST
jgi:DNA-binding MarR family transcriptional regulator